jgi:hypothetical protein
MDGKTCSFRLFTGKLPGFRLTSGISYEKKKKPDGNSFIVIQKSITKI